MAEAGTSSIRDYLKLMRPSHWLKNAFIFAPLVFSKMLLDPERLRWSALAFAVMNSRAH